MPAPFLREVIQMNASSAKRDFLFDNYKALLIVLVIIGHFTDLNYGNNALLYNLKWLISSFHMPAFIFISGYFSKRQHSLLQLVQKLLIPYLVYECVYYLLYTFILHKPTGLYLLYPKFSLWYILALFAWRLATPYFRKIPGHMVIAVAAGLLIGLSGMKDNFLSIPRILVFYPYFLAGYHMERDFFTRMRTRKVRLLSGAGLLTGALFLVFDSLHKTYDPKICYGRYNYDYLGQAPLEGMLVRLICYGAGFALTFLVAFVMTERDAFFSILGRRTMPIYIFHGLVYSCFKYGTHILTDVDTIGESVVLLGFCVLLAFIGSSDILTAITDRVSSLLPLSGGRMQPPGGRHTPLPGGRMGRTA